MLFNLFPSSEGVDGTVARSMGCPMVPRVSFRQEQKKKESLCRREEELRAPTISLF